jgi:hypothetical protein
MLSLILKMAAVMVVTAHLVAAGVAIYLQGVPA